LWSSGRVFGSAAIDYLASRLLEKIKTMVAGRQKIDGCVMDVTTTDLKAKFAKFRCESLRRKSSPRFNTTSFSLVHSREKLWSITIFCNEERKERSFCCISFLPSGRTLYIVA